jgi:hypothetical protein
MALADRHGRRPVSRESGVPGITPDLKPAEATAELRVLGEHPLKLRPDGSPVNYKSCLFLPREGVLPVAVVSSTPGTHKEGLTQAFHVISEERRKAGLGDSMSDVDGMVMGGGCFVPLVISGSGGGVRVNIRPDFEFFFGYRQAVEILTGPQLNIPVERIGLTGVMDPRVREIAKCIGCMHMLNPIDSNEEDIVKSIRYSERTSESGNKYFSSDRMSYMSLTQLRDVLFDLGNRERFQGRLGEIIHLYQERPIQPEDAMDKIPRQLEFLLLDKEMNLNPDTGFIFDGLCRIAEQSKEGAWGETQNTVRESFEALLKRFEGENHPLFNEINLGGLNPVVRNKLYMLIKNIKSEEDMENTKYSGFISPQPGGYIVGQESDGCYTPGVVVPLSKLPEKLRRAIRLRQVDRPTAEYVSFRPEELKELGVESESAHTFRVRGAGRGRVVQRYWVFDRQTEPAVKDALNDILAKNPNLTYGYVCNIPGSHSRRDMMADDARVFGKPARHVNVLVYRTDGGEEVKQLDRVAKWNTMVLMEQGRRLPIYTAMCLARSYEYNLQDRVACIRALCPNAGLPGWSIYHTNVDFKGEVMLPIAHGVREYVDGPPTNMLIYREREKYKNPAYVGSLLGCKGGMAAANMAIGRQLFDDGDEIVSSRDEHGNPDALRLIDPTASFRDVETPLKESTGLYACSMARDLLCFYSSIGAAEKPELIRPPILDTVRSRFYDAFRREFTETQGRYREYRQYFDTLIEARTQKDIKDAVQDEDVLSVEARQKPGYDEWDMRRRWPKALKRLDGSSVDEIIGSLKADTQRVCETGLKVIASNKGRELSHSEQFSLADSFTRMLAMNNRSMGPILETLNGDAEFGSLDYDGRMRRINALRVSTWIHRVGSDRNAVTGYARECMSERTVDEAKEHFIKTVNKEHPRLQISGEMAGIFFDLVKDPKEARMLEKKGYLVK